MNGETVSPYHAAQLARCLGALDVFEAELSGVEARVVGATREVLAEHAEAIDSDVEPAEFARLDKPELRSIAVFCDSVAERFGGDDEQRLVATARIASGHLAEVRSA